VLSSTTSTASSVSFVSGDTGECSIFGTTVPAMFSEDTRQHVIGLLEEGYPASDVAEIIECSPRSMRRWLRHFMVSGTVWRDPRFRNLHGDAAIRNPHLTRAVLTLVETEPFAFLRDHVDLLFALSSDDPESDHRYMNAATVFCALRFRRYTRKKIERLHVESSLDAQRAFAVLFNEIPLRCIVSVQEIHTAGSDMYQRSGRSLRDMACSLRDRGTRPITRTSTMMAVTRTHGVLWAQIVIVGSAQTADDGRLFLQCLHVKMNNYILGLPWEMQPDTCVGLYDNAGIHGQRGHEYMQANGIHFMRLPPYPPNLQPIEGVFSDLKNHVRSLVYEHGQSLVKPLHLMAAAVGRRTAGQVVWQFSRVSHQVSELLAAMVPA